MTDISNIGMIILGAVSLFTLVIKKIANLKFMPILILIFALMVSGLMFYTGKLGGEIMHKEIRIDPGTKL
jgi:uncharacterized membrane protein